MKIVVLLVGIGILLGGCLDDDLVSSIYLQNRIVKSKDGCTFVVHIGSFGCKFLHFKLAKSDPTCPLLKIESQDSEDEEHGEEERD